MKTTTKFFSIFTLIAILALAFATPVMAFDGRSGDNITIEANEVINDDLYVTAQTFTLEGAIKGDLIVTGQTITINGTVDGDLLAMGQSVVINGVITGDVRIAGAALQLGKAAIINEDLLAGGASLETKDGSKIGGELVFGAGQSLLGGNVTGDVFAGTGALELRGEFGGDVTAEVGDANQGNGPSPSMYMPNTSVTIPSVAPGFTIADGAKIKGNLEYTQSKDIKFPANAVDGKITRTEPVVDTAHVKTPPTAAQKAISWSLDLLRTIVSLILFGLLLGWLLPTFMKNLLDKLQSQPAASLGWGIVAYTAFFFVILLVVVTTILGGIVFGFLTLGSISGTIIWVGILAIFELIVGFVLVTSFLAKIVVAWLSGKWIVNRFNPALAEHKVLPLVLGVTIIALLLAIPFVGWFFGLIVMFLGLGALWFWGRELWQARKTA